MNFGRSISQNFSRFMQQIAELFTAVGYLQQNFKVTYIAFIHSFIITPKQHNTKYRNQ